MNLHSKAPAFSLAGLFTLSLRWVIGWTYFSAFWRRLILENKLNPEEAGYIGEKFNHFLPNALGIQSLIEYLVSHPDALWGAMVVFTIIEALVGLALILGVFTRLMSVGVVLLALGILLGSGWIGTTCLDEWQIGILGIAGGFVLFLTGSSAFSIDQWFTNKQFSFTKKSWFVWLGSGELPIKNIKAVVFILSIAIAALTLFTNQVFHGGVFGKLHNKSVKPLVEISQVKLKKDQLQFQLYRVEGADVYGSFLIGIEIVDDQHRVVKYIGMEELATYPSDLIHNHYVAKVKPGKHSLIIPLGAKADLTINLDGIQVKSSYKIKLIDVSGAEWMTSI